MDTPSLPSGTLTAGAALDARSAQLDPLAARLVPWLAAGAAACALLAGALELAAGPVDGAAEAARRIVVVHVPAAWGSLVLYFAMAACAALTLRLNARLPAVLTSALAPTGALFTFLALWTGALSGRPTWGTWWVWDARLTSELILLFLYVGYLALQAAIDDRRRGERACAVLLLVGAVNLRVIHYSVRWWNDLHQGGAAAATASQPLVLGTAVMALAFGLYTAAVVLARARCVLRERQADAQGSLRGEPA